jgi:regulator of cell morphogenesis and NO signaling
VPTAASTSAPEEPGASLHALFEQEHQIIDAALAAYRSAVTARSVDATVAATLREALLALRRHIWLEEEHLFRPLAGTPVTAALLVMLREHAQIWATLDVLEARLDAGVSADESSRALEVQLRHHNLKEERVVYPAADQLLTDTVRASLRELVATGTAPEDWLPIRAR